MKSKVFTLLFCVVALQALAQKSTTEDLRFKGLDTAFQRVLTTWHVAGFAVAVVQKNKVIYAKGFGYRNIATKQLVTPNTMFPIGSCTKSFTAAQIGKLQEEGKLDIDKPVRNYLPELKFYNDALNNTVDLRDMMSHRTGLPRFDMSWHFFGTPSIDSMIRRIQYMEPVSGIRERWEYNNFMYAAQGAVVEKLTGKSWGSNIKEGLFVPLEMTRSNVTIAELEKSSEVSVGYTVRADNSIKEVPYYDIGGMAPAGAINSNVMDMAKWVMAWINSGKYNGKQVIPADFRNEAISSQSIIDGSLPGKEHPDIYFSNYGFGWFVDSYEGHYRVEHGGNTDGFTANTSFFPSDSIGIVVLCNQQESKLPGIVRNLIADKILHLKYHDWNTELKAADDKANLEWENAVNAQTTITKSNPATHPLIDFSGNYNYPAYGTLNVYVQNDSLFAKTMTHSFWLKHATGNSFELFDVDLKEGTDTTRSYGIILQFHSNTSGSIDGFESELENGLKPFMFAKFSK